MRARILSSTQKSRLLIFPISLVVWVASLVAVGPAAAVKIRVTPTVSSAYELLIVTPTVANVGQIEPVKVTALDSANNVEGNYTGDVTLTGGTTDLVSSTKTTFVNTSATDSDSYEYGAHDRGVHTFYIKYGSYDTNAYYDIAPDILTASDGGKPAYNTATVNVEYAPTKLVIEPPSSLQKSTNPYAIDPTQTAPAGTEEDFTVFAENKYGAFVPDFGDTVSFTSSDAKKTTMWANASAYSAPTAPGTYAYTPTDNGTHVFGVDFGTAKKVTLTFKDPGTKVAAASVSVTVSPGPATQLVVSAPKTATTGKAFNVKVTAEDAYGNVAKGYTGTVKLSGATATAYQYTSNDNGVHTFSAQFLGLGYIGAETVAASGTAPSGSGSITGTSSSAPVTVSGGKATQLAIVGPATVTKGVATVYTIEAENTYGGVTTYTGQVTITSTGSDTGTPANITLGANGSQTVTLTLGTVGSDTISATTNYAPKITAGTLPVTVTAPAS
ncbi:MAG: hypothetical protein ACLP8S_22705 [Solirubrobacteraceae bacterium]